MLDLVSMLAVLQRLHSYRYFHCKIGTVALILQAENIIITEDLGISHVTVVLVPLSPFSCWDHYAIMC